jgi:SAM-dependent methyltransferase
MRSVALPDQQQWCADSYSQNARFVSDLGGDVLALLAPKHGERILDLGCGDGALTERIMAAGANVLGIDISASLLEAARGRGVDARYGDAMKLAFDGEFDAVFSNAVLHWVREPRTAALGIRRALKPGGRFVAEFGGHGNVAAIVTALRAAADTFGGDAALVAPWFYPTADEYRAILRDCNFDVRQIALIPRQTPLTTGIEGWLATFRAPFFAQFGPERADEVKRWVVELLRPSLCDASGRWTADYVRLRVAAIAA